MFSFRVTNMRTKESATFLGQGEKMEEAFKDGLKNAADTFRASSSGKIRPENCLACHTPDGRVVQRMVRDFESDRGA